MKIQVLGVGCSSCHSLFELTKRAVKELNINDEVEYIDDMKMIVSMGVMQVPVLAIDGKPVLTGAISDIEIIKKALSGKDVPNTDSLTSKNISSGNDRPDCSCGKKC